MLKFTYTETSIKVEQLNEPLEEVVSRQVLLAIRLANSLIVEPGRATLLLPANLSKLAILRKAVQQSRGTIALCPCDADFVEVSLQGVWIAADHDRAEGIFLTDLENLLAKSFRDQVELLILQLWQSFLPRILMSSFEVF